MRHGAKLIKKTIKSLKKRTQELNALLYGGSKTLVLSDSHGGVFEYMHDRGMLSPHIVNAEIVGGATAYGLQNDSSTTKAFAKFQNALKRFSDYDTILIQLGEVDSAFVLWKKAQTTKSPQELASLSLPGYKRLLDEIFTNYKNKRVVVTGAVLPTLKDSQSAPKDAALRDEISVSLVDRTKLVLALNEELKKLAASYGYDYLDITSESLDEESGVIKEEFVVLEKPDHHHDFKKSAPLWELKLKEYLKGSR